MDETVRVQVLDGVWEVLGRDRFRGAWAEDVQCTWDDWGPKTASLTLKRDPQRPTPDLLGLTPLEIEKASGIWDGFLDVTPQGDEHSLQVSAIGWQDHGNDDSEQKLYVHAGLSDWVDQRSYLTANLTAHRRNGEVEVGDGVIRLGFRATDTVAAGDCAAVTFDAGPGNLIKRVSVDATSDGGFAFIGARMYVIGSDVSQWEVTGGGRLDYITNQATPNATFSGNLAGSVGRRYVTILCFNPTTAGVLGADCMLSITGARLFGEIAYEGGNLSILKASDVLKDALPRLCPQWSSDVSGVDATLLNLPEVAPTAPRTFPELTEALNGLHGYVRKLERGRRFRFKARPIAPLLSAGSWPGVSFRNTSKNATRELYNKAVGLGTKPYGEPIRIERYAGQQPGVPLDLVSSPSFPNPSFDVNTTGWTVSGGTATITRDTGTFQSGPAGALWDSTVVPTTLTTALSGTFLKGVAYAVEWYSKWFGAQPWVKFGTTTDFAQMRAASSDDGSGAFVVKRLVWVPKATVTGVSLTFFENLDEEGAVYLDTFSLGIARPTLLDRRSRVRSKTVTIPSQATDETVVQAFADLWLQSHMRTPAQGDLTVRGPAIREHTSGKKVDPFEVGNYIGELICLLDEVDPDTGAVGRNLPVVGVSYNGNEETAQVTLDSTNEDFEKMVARYDLLSGGGV